MLLKQIKNKLIITTHNKKFKAGRQVKLAFDYLDHAYYFYHIKEKLMYEMWFGECKVEFYKPKWRKR